MLEGICCIFDLNWPGLFFLKLPVGRTLTEEDCIFVVDEVLSFSSTCEIIYVLLWLRKSKKGSNLKMVCSLIWVYLNTGRVGIFSLGWSCQHSLSWRAHRFWCGTFIQLRVTGIDSLWWSSWPSLRLFYRIWNFFKFQQQDWLLLLNMTVNNCSKRKYQRN